MKTNIKAGQIFCRLTVIPELAPDKITNSGARERRVMCLCSCGNKVPVIPRSLTSGNNRSCGCLRKETERTNRLTHGAASNSKRTGAYRSWAHMKSRCFNPMVPKFKYYGGRGITVCKRWLSFENFIKDMGERPPGMSIDRFPNKDGNYEPGNCRWADKFQQTNNAISNRWYEYQGKRMTLGQWARELGCRWEFLDDRLRLGWDFSRAILEPKHK